MELINKVSEKLAASSSRETRNRKLAPLENGGETVWKRVFIESVQLAASINRRINRRNWRISESNRVCLLTRPTTVRRSGCLFPSSFLFFPFSIVSLNHRPRFLQPCFLPEKDEKFGKIVEAKFPTDCHRSTRMTRDWKTVVNCEKISRRIQRANSNSISREWKAVCISGKELEKKDAMIGQRNRTRENFIPLEGKHFLNPIEDRELCSNAWRVNPYTVLLSPWKTGKYRGLS